MNMNMNIMNSRTTGVSSDINQGNNEEMNNEEIKVNEVKANEVKANEIKVNQNTMGLKATPDGLYSLYDVLRLANVPAYRKKWSRKKHQCRDWHSQYLFPNRSNNQSTPVASIANMVRILHLMKLSDFWQTAVGAKLLDANARHILQSLMDANQTTEAKKAIDQRHQRDLNGLGAKQPPLGVNDPHAACLKEHVLNDIPGYDVLKVRNIYKVYDGGFIVEPVAGTMWCHWSLSWHDTQEDASEAYSRTFLKFRTDGRYRWYCFHEQCSNEESCYMSPLLQLNDRVHKLLFCHRPVVVNGQIQQPGGRTPPTYEEQRKVDVLQQAGRFNQFHNITHKEQVERDVEMLGADIRAYYERYGDQEYAFVRKAQWVEGERLRSLLRKTWKEVEDKMPFYRQQRQDEKMKQMELCSSYIRPTRKRKRQFE